MLLDVKEDSACILIEKSRQTELFLPAIKELIIGWLLEKSNRSSLEETNVCRFNIGYFDKEPVFWTGQATQCSNDKANIAAQWIRSWTTSSYGRDSDISSTGSPHTMMSIVAAFNDPFVGALYLFVSSLPFESADDLINHAKFASKDRPIHVIFLTARSRVDERAMELFHVLSRKTGGSFRAVYYDGNGSKYGRLIEVPALSRDRSKSGITAMSGDSESSIVVTPVPLVPVSPPVENTSSFQESPRDRGPTHRFHDSPSVDSFSDIIIKTPIAGSKRTTPTIGREILIHTSRLRHSSQPSAREEAKFVPLENHIDPDDNLFHLESARIPKSPVSNRNPELDEIKKEFTEFYWTRRHQPETSARSSTTARHNHEPLPSSKSVEFEPAIGGGTHRSRRASFSPTPDSLSDDEPLEKYTPRKLITPRETTVPLGSARRSKSPELPDRSYATPIGSTRLSSRPPTGRRSSRSPPVTIYTKSHFTPILHNSYSNGYQIRPSPISTFRSGMSTIKPAWRPATGRKHFVTSPTPNKIDGRMGTEDRSRAWMNRWMNDWVQKSETKYTTTNRPTNAAVRQAEVERELAAIAAPLLLQRSKSEPRKLQVTTYTQTPHEEKRVEEEIHTIRELVTQNTNLLDAVLGKSDQTVTHRYPPTIPQQHHKPGDPQRKVHSHDLAKLNALRTSHYPTSTNEKIAATPRRKGPTVGGVHRSRSQAAMQTEPLWLEWDQSQKTRREQLKDAMDRKEGIRHQHEQACYKAMYEKLADDVTQRSYPMLVVQPQAASSMNQGTKTELIARLPYNVSSPPVQDVGF